MVRRRLASAPRDTREGKGRRGTAGGGAAQCSPLGRGGGGHEYTRPAPSGSLSCDLSSPTSGEIRTGKWLSKGSSVLEPSRTVSASWPSNAWLWLLSPQLLVSIGVSSALWRSRLGEEEEERRECSPFTGAQGFGEGLPLWLSSSTWHSDGSDPGDREECTRLSPAG